MERQKTQNNQYNIKREEQTQRTDPTQFQMPDARYRSGTLNNY